MHTSDGLREFRAEIDRAIDAALKSARGGDADWAALLDFYAITPLPDQQKEALLGSEMKISKGAFPIELRRVLAAIIEKHANSHSDPVFQDALRSFDVDAEIAKYHAQIKKPNGLSSIFKNAKASSSRYSRDVGSAKQHTYQCGSCGAPRVETMQYNECVFCGSKLFEPANKDKSS